MIRNLTPHDVTLLLPGGARLFFPKEDRPPVRVIRRERQGRVPTFTPRPERYPAIIQDLILRPALPEPEPNTLLIVSRLVFEASDRRDLEFIRK